MPKGKIPAEFDEVLSRPNPAIIATVRADGQPVSVPTWYAYVDGRILLNMDVGRRRLGYLRNDPRLSLTVLNGSDWYSHLSLQGRVTDFSDDADLSGIDRLSRLYTGQPYDNRERPRVNVWAEVDFWHSWGELAQS